VQRKERKLFIILALYLYRRGVAYLNPYLERRIITRDMVPSRRSYGLTAAAAPLPQELDPVTKYLLE